MRECRWRKGTGLLDSFVFFLIFDRFLNTYKNGIYRLVLFFLAAMLDSSIFHDVCVQFFF